MSEVFCAKSYIQVNRSAEEVFDAIVDPIKLCRYFTTTSTGPLTSGSTVTWHFADYNATKNVFVEEVIENKSITFTWDAVNSITRVRIYLETPEEANHIGGATTGTIVRVVESCDEWALNEDSLNKIRGQTYGWTHFLFCLKGFMLHGINLRSNE